jgi:hypothetical protein
MMRIASFQIEIARRSLHWQTKEVYADEGGQRETTKPLPAQIRGCAR